MKEVDFDAVVFKVAFLFLILRLPGCGEWLANYEFWGAVGWISFSLPALLVPVCCFFAVRKTGETEDTRRFSVFIIRLFGLCQALAALWSVPWTVKYLTSPEAWQYNVPQVLHGLVLLYGISLLAIPNQWNRLILLLGRLLRRY